MPLCKCHRLERVHSSNDGGWLDQEIGWFYLDLCWQGCPSDRCHNLKQIRVRITLATNMTRQINLKGCPLFFFFCLGFKNGSLLQQFKRFSAIRHKLCFNWIKYCSNWVSGLVPPFELWFFGNSWTKKALPKGVTKLITSRRLFSRSFETNVPLSLCQKGFRDLHRAIRCAFYPIVYPSQGILTRPY